ncbi:uncharacterized protein F5Z01DRAFT_634838 [Emericellopsis atlantica]|uniref:Uncharacterized protein n=1 Tax=Emericellopsis atlantica TaxID=2614577 RepID=A0A9P7ZQL7_9HYPO|nr:uncharacterized protein F5Z01DRAFT_634838 [Emericellopsis atlantica]KAG9255858.1 hypothetical protein F5Z01DRAFT_634838 [Emericellopsis atlantica]
MPSAPSPPHHPKRARATLDERPSSSSGPGFSQPSSRHNDYDKRRSRDDLLVGLMTTEKREQTQQQYRLQEHHHRQQQQQRYKSFHVPIRGGPPQAQVPSPQAPGFAQSSFSSQGSTTPIADSRGIGDAGAIAIGMALGSPSHPPPDAGWIPRPDKSATERTPTGTRPAAAIPEEEATPKKSRKWALFRSKSKSAKKKDNASPPQTSVRSPATARPSALRSDTVDAPPSRSAPQVVRSQTAPVMASSRRPQPPQPAQASRQSPRPPPRHAQTTPAPAPSPSAYDERPVPAAGPQLPTSRSGPMLDVEIPDITLERYSVMFGQVLMNKRRQSRDLLTSSSSLLARRQATLDKLAPVAGEAKAAELSPLQPPPSRAPVTLVKESPTFHLFPPSSRRSSSAQAQSPRSRSNTSPAGLPSPGLPSAGYNNGLAGMTPPMAPALRAQTLPRTAHENHSMDRLPNTDSPVHRRPQLASRFTRQLTPITTTNTTTSASTPVFDSPTSIEESAEAVLSATYQPSANDPAWEMISPPPSSHDSDTPKKNSLSSVVSSEQIAVVKPTVTVTDQDAEAEKALREAVQASITRQISVSREQRSMLGSIRGRTPRGQQGSVPVGFGPVVVSDGNERLSETRKLTPRVVHPGDENTPRSFHTHRRSERVVVEGL